MKVARFGWVGTPWSESKRRHKMLNGKGGGMNGMKGEMIK